MQIDVAGLRSSITDGIGAPPEIEGRFLTRPTSRLGEDTPDASADAAPALEIAPAAVAAPAEWMDPLLGGLSALGTAEHYLPLLQALHEELSQRQDPIARMGGLAILEELHNHTVLTLHLNSLIA